MRPLHICYISQEYPAETGWGGVGSYTYEMAHGLVRAGHRVTVICAGGRQRERHRLGRSYRASYPAQSGVGPLAFLWRLNRFWPGFAWAAARRLKQIHSDCSVDVVEAAENRADSFFVPLLVRGPRRVVRLHTPWIFIDRLNSIVPDRRKRFIYYQEARTIRSADLVTSPCRAMVDLTETWISLKGRAVAVVPNPVNTDTFVPGEDPKRGEILVVGRLEQRKGAALLAEALPNVLRRCPRASSASLAATAWIRAVGRGVSGFAGGVGTADRMPSSFRASPPRDPDRSLPAGRVMRVAVGVGEFSLRPAGSNVVWSAVVGTRSGGLPELIEDGVSGLIVPPADPAALAEACAVLCKMPSFSAAWAAQLGSA